MQCILPQSTPITVSMLFLEGTITHGCGRARPSTCSCPRSRYCTYLTFSRQECISARLPNVSNLASVTSALPQNVNFEPQAERFYILLSLPRLHLLLFLSVLSIVILSSPFHSSRGALCCFWLTEQQQAHSEGNSIRSCTEPAAEESNRLQEVCDASWHSFLSAIPQWFLSKHPVPHQTL